MKVLWVASAHPPDGGGVATHGRLLAPALRDAGVELEVWCLRDQELQHLVDGVPVRRFKTGVHLSDGDGAAVMRDRRTFDRLLHESQPDVVHAHGPDPMVALVQTLPVVRRQVPLVTTLHTPSAALERQGATSRALDDSTVVVTVSEGLRRGLLADAPHLATRTVALPNCVPLGPAPQPPPAAPTVLAGGRLAHQKGIDVLLEAWAAVHRVRADARLVLCGEGEEELALRERCRRLGLDEVVSFVGQQQGDALEQRLAGARFVVMASRFEGMPYLALEAARAGRAVVGTTVAGLDEVVLDGETGVLVPPEDPAALAVAIIELLDDPDGGARLGLAAHDHVLRHHGLDEAVHAHLAVYRRAVTPSPRPKVVSVVVPAFQAERWVGEAVQSATTQRLPEGHEVEVVVVDDGSTDATVAAARAASSDAVVVRACRSRAGGARNTGLALATGELVAFLDADDLWPPDRTAVLLDALARTPGAEGAFGVAVEFGEGEGVAARPDPVATRMPNAGLFSRRAVERTGGWITGRSGEVVDWTARFLATDPVIAWVDVVTLERRVHDDNTGRGVQAQRNRLAALKQHLDRRRATEADPTGPGDVGRP